MWSTATSSSAQPLTCTEPEAPGNPNSPGMSMNPKGAWLMALFTMTVIGPSVKVDWSDSVTFTDTAWVPFV